MFVWGAKGEVVNLGTQATRHCPTCEKERPFQLMLQYTARHFWYMFKWVTGKQYGLVCEVCHRGDKLDAKAVEAKLKKSPIPFGTRWSWAFLAGLVAIAAVFGTLNDLNRSSEREAYLAAPAKGDRYIVNAAHLLKNPQSKYLYGVLRVRSVRADAIEFDATTMFYSGASAVEKDIDNEKIDDPGYFSPTPIVISRAEIARLHKEHAIHSIVRFSTKPLARL
jgi:hypothetical protein